MGDMADWLIDRLLDEEFFRVKEIQTNCHLEIWRTNDGDVLSIEDMEDRHIENCIKAIKDEKIDLQGYKDAYLSLFEAELSRRIDKMLNEEDV